MLITEDCLRQPKDLIIAQPREAIVSEGFCRKYFGHWTYAAHGTDLPYNLLPLLQLLPLIFHRDSFAKLSQLFINRRVEDGQF